MSDKLFTEIEVRDRENKAYREGCEVAEKEKISRQREKEEVHSRGFYMGVLEVLILLTEQKGISYDEIVQCLGEEELIKRARKEAKLKASGLGEYEKRMRATPC